MHSNPSSTVVVPPHPPSTHTQPPRVTSAQARRLIIQSNLRLVISISTKFKNRGVPLQDLIQVPSY